MYLTINIQNNDINVAQGSTTTNSALTVAFATVLKGDLGNEGPQGAKGEKGDTPDISGKQDKGDNSLKTISRSVVGAINELCDHVITEEQHAYGIEWNVTIPSPICLRIGSISLHRSFPIQNGIKGSLLSDEGTVIEYLNPINWREHALDGSAGQVMVERYLLTIASSLRMVTNSKRG